MLNIWLEEKPIKIRLVLLLRTFENKNQAQFVPFFNVLRFISYRRELDPQPRIVNLRSS